MHTEGIAGVHHPCAFIEGEHGVWPVQVGGHHELQLVALAQVQRVTPLCRIQRMWGVGYKGRGSDEIGMGKREGGGWIDEAKGGGNRQKYATVAEH